MAHVLLSIRASVSVIPLWISKSHAQHDEAHPPLVQRVYYAGPKPASSLALTLSFVLMQSQTKLFAFRSWSWQQGVSLQRVCLPVVHSIISA